MSLSYYDPYFRITGVRLFSHLTTPPLVSLSKLQLPRGAVLHYTGVGQVDVAPNPEDPIFRGYSKPIAMDHIVTLQNPEGRPVHVPGGLVQDIKDFHANGRNRRFRRLQSLESVIRDDMTLVVYNYGYLKKAYKYPRSVYTDYYRWKNEDRALWSNVVTTIDATKRHQFIRCQLPKLLPSITEMTLGEKGVTQSMVQLFDSPESLMLLEIWKWLGKDRASADLAVLSTEQAESVNLLFVESGRWFVLNLGVLDSWRKATDDEIKANPKAHTKGHGPKEVQIYFLRLMMALMEVRSVSGPETAVKELAEAGAKGTVVQKTAKVPVFNRETGKVELHATGDDLTLVGTGDTKSATETGADLKVNPRTVEEMTEALNKLEFLAQQRLQLVDTAEEEDADAVPVVEATPESNLKAILDQKAADGIITGAEYKRYSEQGAAYKTMLAPDGSTTLEQFAKVAPELVAMETSPRIPDIDTVFDKTMLKSSLLEYDSRYVKEVFQRDVASMVLSVQNAGIAVTGYETETIEDIVGASRMYTLRLSPIEGAASTVRFKLPIVDDEGVYRANGINYKLRKQDVELPIVKVSPSKVALTSYFGKTFVTRSDKRVNDHTVWLKNAIMAKGLDVADQTVIDLYPSNVFDNLFVCPRLYSSLAMAYRGFTVAGFALNFDHTKREELYTKAVLDLYEKDGAVVCGSNSKNQFVVMDKFGTLYSAQDGVVTDMGSLEEIIHLDGTKAPVDFAELKVRGRTIPLGVVLGYEMGLTKLMGLLKVRQSVRRVPAGGRKQLQPNEYALEFSDESLIFNRDDQLASLVLGGFREFHKGIRNYSVYEFDRPAVYLNILDMGGSATRYLREIDLMYQMFIDPITKELLAQMKEPTEFRRLLLRSAELLLVDHHPDEGDDAFRRKRGYERMAGAVYTNLVESIRAHNSRGAKSKLPIELHPYAVWKAIAEDPSVSLVSEINPIQNLKEIEAVTHGGVGGRSSRSMTKHTRAFHRNAMGVISESTVDSSDVGINTYMSADPQFTSLRGMHRPYDMDKKDPTSLVSTSALVSVGADGDD
jgi:hypothetical protein